MNNFQSAWDTIRQKWSSSQSQILAIEGFTGVGKTSLAKLAKAQGFEVIEIDEFMRRDGRTRSYRKRINYALLQRKIETCLRSSMPFVIEGVCLRQLVRTNDCFFVYVKRMSAIHPGLWYEAEPAECGFDIKVSHIDRSVGIYHKNRRPHLLADHCVELQEPPARCHIAY